MALRARKIRDLTHVISGARLCAGVLAFVVALAGGSPQASAGSADPFEFEAGRWMSFERYKDNVRRGLPVPDFERRRKEKAESGEDGAKKPAAAGGDGDDESDKPEVAAPTRPLAPPMLPGMNKGFEIDVGSTLDDTRAWTDATDGTPELNLKEQNWQDAVDAARRQAKNGGTWADNAPLSVRMALLPAFSYTPVPPEKKKLQTPVPQKKESPPDQAACDAINAYKKRQLEALQSDRQTLEALQNAIAKLGLQKELNFMPGTRGSLTLPAPEGPSIPVAPSAKKKKGAKGAAPK